MIINRYITRQIFLTTMTIVSLLVVILIGGRIISFLGRVVDGRIDVESLFILVGLALPILLPYLIPIGFFMAVLIVFGRMYAENEASVLKSTGFSEIDFVKFLALPTLMLSLLVIVMVMWLAPWSETQTFVVESDQRNRADIDQVTPGTFYESSIDGVDRVIFIENRSLDKTQLEDIFVAETYQKADRPPSTLFAKSGHIETIDGQRYLVLQNGYRQQGQPGQADYQIIEFNQYQTRLPSSEGERRIKKVRALPTEYLWDKYSEDSKYRIEFHWRMNFVFMCLILALLAIPMSRLKPRRSRYSRLFPAVMIYLVYLGILIAIKQGSKNQDSLYWLYYLVHVIFALWGIWNLKVNNRDA